MAENTLDPRQQVMGKDMDIDVNQDFDKMAGTFPVIISDLQRNISNLFRCLLRGKTREIELESEIYKFLRVTFGFRLIALQFNY